MSVRLLLVDDHRMVREGLGRSLEPHGFEVVGQAGDGYVGVERAVELNPDVVLMDVTIRCSMVSRRPGASGAAYPMFGW